MGNTHAVYKPLCKQVLQILKSLCDPRRYSASCKDSAIPFMIVWHTQSRPKWEKNALVIIQVTESFWLVRGNAQLLHISGVLPRPRATAFPTEWRYWAAPMTLQDPRWASSGPAMNNRWDPANQTPGASGEWQERRGGWETVSGLIKVRWTTHGRKKKRWLHCSQSNHHLTDKWYFFQNAVWNFLQIFHCDLLHWNFLFSLIHNVFKAQHFWSPCSRAGTSR